MKTLNELIISRPPWKISVHCPYVVMDGLYEGKDEIVKSESTMVHDAPFTPEYKLRGKIMENDSRLIASAPELYECLRNLLIIARNRIPYQPTLYEIEVLRMTESVLAKASGDENEVSK